MTRVRVTERAGNGGSRHTERDVAIELHIFIRERLEKSWAIPSSAKLRV